jgi:hypothetical protein
VGCDRRARPHAARQRYHRSPIDVDLVESALLRAATDPSDDIRHAAAWLSGEVGELLNYLERADSDIKTRARLEFLYSCFLHLTRPARALGEALQTDSSLFAEILSYVYFAEGESRDQEVPRNGSRSPRSDTPLSAPGVRLLASAGTAPWTPGVSALVTEAGRLLAESGRPAVGDIAIGQVLAHVPPDRDGLWSGEPIRDMVEDLASQKFEVGLHTGKFNSRSTVTWSMTERGEQERGLAAQYRASADRVADQWPGRSVPAPDGRQLRGVGPSGG